MRFVEEALGKKKKKSIVEQLKSFVDKCLGR